MPTVPTVSLPSVAPTPNAGSSYFSSAGATPEAFGAGIGAAEEKLGKQLESTSDVLAKHALRMQTTLNKADVDNTSIDYMKAQGQLDSAFYSLEGRDAVVAHQDYIDNSVKLREEYSGNLKNPEQKEMFDSMTRARLASSMHKSAMQTGSQLKAYKAQTNERMVSQATSLVQSDPSSDANFNEAKSLSATAVAQQAEIHGWDENETAARQKDNESNMLATRIQAMAQKDPAKAQDLFDANKDKLKPETKSQVETQLASGKYKAGSEAAVKAYGVKRMVEADIESVSKTGVGVPGVDARTVRAAVGDLGVEKWKADRADANTVWWHTYELPTTPVANMEKQLVNLTPKPGSPTFDREQKVYDTVAEAMGQQIKLRSTDPALSVQSDPAVQAALKADAPQVLIGARLAAQTRAGIPPEMQSPITIQEGVSLMQPLKQALPGDEYQVLQDIAKKAQKQYGDNWEQAFTFGAKAAKLNSLTSLAAATTLRKVLNNQTPTVEDAQNIDNANEETQAKRAATLVPAEPPKKVPLSKRILEGK